MKLLAGIQATTATAIAEAATNILNSIVFLSTITKSFWATYNHTRNDTGWCWWFDKKN